jgi:hypothetical protein
MEPCAILAGEEPWIIKASLAEMKRGKLGSHPVRHSLGSRACTNYAWDGYSDGAVRAYSREGQEMKFSIYSRFLVEVRRENESWVVYRAEMGKRTRLNDVVIPSDLGAHEIAGYLDDIFHEYAGIGQCVELLQD